MIEVIELQDQKNLHSKIVILKRKISLSLESYE